MLHKDLPDNVTPLRISGYLESSGEPIPVTPQRRRAITPGGALALLAAGAVVAGIAGVAHKVGEDGRHSLRLGTVEQMRYAYPAPTGENRTLVVTGGSKLRLTPEIPAGDNSDANVIDQVSQDKIVVMRGVVTQRDAGGSIWYGAELVNGDSTKVGPQSNDDLADNLVWISDGLLHQEHADGTAYVVQGPVTNTGKVNVHLENGHFATINGEPFALAQELPANQLNNAVAS